MGPVDSSTFVLVAGSFLASAVEMVEALTIVLAAGLTRGWRSSLTGVGAAALALAVVVAALGPALTLVPIDALRLVVGGLLLVFGLQWLRKAILRAGGFKARHDEEAIYAAEVARLQASGTRTAHDWYAFTVAFKGVLLEGLEVVFIVIAFGSAQGELGLAALGAALAFVLVLVMGFALHRPLSRVPENTIKFVVGLLLTTFGCFWAAEGVGVAWPGDELALLGVLAFFVATSLGLVWVLRQGRVAAAVSKVAA
jgi:uncharacterized membrane protein